MKTLFKKPLTTGSHFLLTASQCKKNVPSAQFYFQCKVNGHEYTSNSSANCRVAKLLGDTSILINGNFGFETIGISLIKRGCLSVTNTSFKLDQNPQHGATYKNETAVNGRYYTDFLHAGILEIISLDRSTKVISGIFSFQAHNAVLNKTINITDGKFRLKYFDN